MSLEVGLPANMVCANSGSALGRKSSRAASNDPDSTGAQGGFGAILANVDEGVTATEYASNAKDRCRTSDEPDVNPGGPSSAIPNVTAPEEIGGDSDRASKTTVLRDVSLQPPGIGPGVDIVDQGSIQLDLSLNLRIPAPPAADADSLIPIVERLLGEASLPQLNRSLSREPANQRFRSDGTTKVELVESVAASVQSVDCDLQENIRHLEAFDMSKELTKVDVGNDLLSAEIKVSELQGPQEVTLTGGWEAAKEGQRAAVVAGNIGLVVPNLSTGMAAAKNKHAKDTIGEDALRVNDGVSAKGAAVRPDDGSFRARISLEIRLLTQQSSLSREAIDPQQYVAVEPELPKYGRATEWSLGTLELRGEVNGPGAELGTASDSGNANASVSLDGFLATATDRESSGAYWISGDLKNAKIKLGDAAEGVVEVSISLQGNQAQVAFKADETMTRNALQDSGSELKEMLRRDGIELSGVSVGTSGAGDGGGDRERSRSENRRSTPLQVVASSLESPTWAGLTSSAQRLDLYV